MESSNMKNMVVLKNLPSNMIEEAIIVFKEKQKVREKELIEKNNKTGFEERQTKSKEYILREAEMLLSDYINKIENKKHKEFFDRNIQQKYQNLKKYSITTTILLIISLIINFI